MTTQQCIYLLMFLATALASCSRTEEVSTGDKTKGSNASTATYAESIIQVDRNMQRRGSGTVSGAGAVANLLNLDSAESVDGGAITINGTIIPKWQIPSGTIYQTRDTFNIPIYYNGSMNRFRVSGGAGYPAFSDSCPSPQGLTTITYPTTSDTVSKEKGTTVTWSGGAPCDGVTVQIRTPGHEPIITKDLPADPGSVTIASSLLESIPSGPIDISVARRNEKRGNLSISKKYRIMVTTTDIVGTYLK